MSSIPVSPRSGEFIQTAVDIALAVENGASPSDPAIVDLLNSIVDDFGVLPIVGTDDYDLINAPRESLNYINGLGGNDLIFGRGGTDVIVGGEGNDRLYGGRGDDGLFGGHGDDVMYGGTGNDHLRGGFGRDIMNAGSGDDFMHGGFDNDVMYGKAGNDIMEGADGNDFLAGGLGDDSMGGGAGRDRVFGMDGDDYIAGNDGIDFLYGGEGNDILVGGSDRDLLLGGHGIDQFVFDPSNENEGKDLIRDFELGTDRIVLYAEDILAATDGIDMADGVEGLSGADLDASDDWMLMASADGDLLVVHPGGQIEVNGVHYDESLTFEALVELGAVDVL